MQNNMLKVVSISPSQIPESHVFVGNSFDIYTEAKSSCVVVSLKRVYPGDMKPADEIFRAVIQEGYGHSLIIKLNEHVASALGCSMDLLAIAHVFLELPPELRSSKALESTFRNVVEKAMIPENMNVIAR